MGNEAIAHGAVAAGVGFVSGYPGTPSTEILETVARINPGRIYVEWSVNEKVALEVAAGAAIAGMRALVTMKQVGLNVASDPLMSLAYVGVKGGLVLVVADDPGPISSQTEQDTRDFARFCRIPVFDPSTPEEACAMVAEAFACSEAYSTPVILRPTTRICHSYAGVEVAAASEPKRPEGFVKDDRWVIFPRLSYQRRIEIEARNPQLGAIFSTSPYNRLEGEGEKLIATGGVSDAYVREALQLLGNPPCRLLKIGTPHPFPDDLARQALTGVSSALVVEELYPVIERELAIVAHTHRLEARIQGKITGDLPFAGEYSVEKLRQALAGYLELPLAALPPAAPVAPSLPVRPPVLCSGCPHRASFYAVKKAMKRKKAIFTGDIGCYTLGNAAPLSMVDTCLCMGAGITMAQGLQVAEPDAKLFAFIGDSTFYHSGLTGVANAVYNQREMVVVVLDNQTTAMTGDQPHPGTGCTMMGSQTPPLDIEAALKALGVAMVLTVDPLDLKASVDAVKTVAASKGVSALIFRSPCITNDALKKKATPLTVIDDLCNGCTLCVIHLGCPALTMVGKKAVIETTDCNGCSLCVQLCPKDAFEEAR